MIYYGEPHKIGKVDDREIYLVKAYAHDRSTRIRSKDILARSYDAALVERSAAAAKAMVADLRSLRRAEDMDRKWAIGGAP